MPVCQSTFQFIPKAFSGVEVRALSSLLEILHIKLVKLCLYFWMGYGWTFPLDGAFFRVTPGVRFRSLLGGNHTLQPKVHTTVLNCMFEITALRFFLWFNFNKA